MNYLYASRLIFQLSMQDLIDERNGIEHASFRVAG